MREILFQFDKGCNIEQIRKGLASLTYKCLASQRPISKSEFTDSIPKLCYKYYRSTKATNVSKTLNELIWKYSEISGKYLGCQYWSDQAAVHAMRSIQELGNPNLGSCPENNKLMEKLSKKTRGKDRIVHEHVFCRAELVRLLLNEAPADEGSVRTLLDRFGVACIVLGSEDDSIRKVRADRTNPWLRYQGKIRLYNNPNWPQAQRTMIEAAGLL